MFADKISSVLFGSRMERALDALAGAYAAQERFSGAVLVARGDRVLLRKAYGSADQQRGIANTPATAFRIASMSKPFTAIAVMQLIEQGQLSLNDHLNKFMPDYPHGDQITVAHLLANRSGIEDFIAMPEFEQMQAERVTPEQLMTLFRERPLRFVPGTEVGYSNANWVLLAVIIERITGRTYWQYAQEHILKPAGMHTAGFDWAAVTNAHATGYVDTANGLQPVTMIDSSVMLGGGDVHATVDDLLHWMRALIGGKLIRPDTLRLMTQAHTQTDGDAYGYGFELRDYFGRHSIGHSGGMPGFVSNIVYFPGDDVTIILLSNLGSAAWEGLTRDLVAAVLGEAYELPSARSFITVDPALLAEYVGEYEIQYFGRTSILRFEIEGDQLVMKTRGLPKAVMSAMAENKFFARSKGEVEMTFVRDANGRVDQIDCVWGGHALTAHRLDA